MKNIDSINNIVNVDSVNYSFLANYKQEDDAVLTVDLYKNGVEFDVSNQKVSLAAIREDKIIIEQLEGFSINKNKVTINLKNNILEVAGTVLCELSIVDSQGAMTTTDFKIKVNKKILTVDAIDANDIETINSIKKEEAIRVENENTRKSNEEVRKSNEINRINKENERNSSEEVRVTNELTRNENEGIRKSQETERVNAENIRNSNEEIRKSNEIDRENRFDIVEANANSLIGEMQNTIDSNISTEVIEARKDKAKLGLRLDDIETQSVENTNSIENILQELINCIKKDGSIPFETGQDKGVKIGENIDIVEGNNSIYIRNKSNPDDFKTLQLTHDGFLLPAGNLQIGSGNYRFRKIWVGAESNLIERGFVTLTNDWVLIFGAVNNAPGQEAARFEFPMRVERFLHPSLTGQWMHDHNHYWTLGMTDYQTYIEVIKHNNIGVSDQCNIMLLCKI